MLFITSHALMLHGATWDHASSRKRGRMVFVGFGGRDAGGEVRIQIRRSLFNTLFKKQKKAPRRTSRNL